METAQDIMTLRPTRLPLTATVAEAYRALHEADARHLPVVSHDGALVGMVSDRDLGALPLADWLADARAQEVLAAPLSTVMATSLVTARPDTPLDALARLMIDHRIGALPVVRADGRTLVGIVSYVDVLRALCRLCEAAHPAGASV